MIPFFSAEDVGAAVSPERALDAVRDAFVAYARGEWTMPPKVYVPAYPAGDFRAMPALGSGHALLKWVTALRTGAAAVLAAETLGREDAETAAVVGAGVNGEATARTFAARGRVPLIWDVDEARAHAVAERVGGRVATRDEA